MGEPAEPGGDGSKNFSGKLQDKKSRAEDRARADAQSYAKLGKSQRTESGFGRKEMGFKTSSQTKMGVADRDLERRATEGQISQRNIDNLGLGQLNEYGKRQARGLQDKIASGGTRVYDESGRIQGVVHTANTIFGPQSVYSGRGSYNPQRTGAKIDPNIKGYDSKRSNPLGGDDDNTFYPLAPPEDKTGSTLSSTKMNNAAKRQRVASLGAGGGGANRRKFV